MLSNITFTDSEVNGDADANVDADDDDADVDADDADIDVKKKQGSHINSSHNEADIAGEDEDDSLSRYPWMLPNDAYYDDTEHETDYEAERRIQEEASVELTNTKLPSPTSPKKEHRDTNAKETKPSSPLKSTSLKPPRKITKNFGGKNPKSTSNKYAKKMGTVSGKRLVSTKKQKAKMTKQFNQTWNRFKSTLLKSPKGCGFDAEFPVMEFRMTKTSIPDFEHSVEPKLTEVGFHIKDYVQRSLKDEEDDMPFTVFQVDPASGTFTKITKKSNEKVWNAANEIVETHNYPVNTIVDQEFYEEYEFSKKVMVTSIRGLYNEDSLWQYKPSNPGPDTFEISGNYSANVKKSFKDIKDLAAGFNGTADSIAKVHKLFADSMTANFPYRLSGKCGNVCGKESCRQTTVKMPANIHILAGRRYIDPITGNRFYNATLFSDGKYDSFVSPYTQKFIRLFDTE